MNPKTTGAIWLVFN